MIHATVIPADLNYFDHVRPADMTLERMISQGKRGMISEADQRDAFDAQAIICVFKRINLHTP